MKRISMYLLVCVWGVLPMFSQTVTIPDANFLSALINEGVDTNNDGQISTTEAEAVTVLEIEGSYDSPDNITDMSGIEAFVNLTKLDCSENQISYLSISDNPLLIDMDCSYNQITNLDLSNNSSIIELDCTANPLLSLDVSSCPDLKILYCSATCSFPGCWGGNFTGLDVSKNLLLEELSCGGHQLSHMDISKNTELTKLFVDFNNLTSLDASNNVKLTNLSCTRNDLSSLDVSSCTELVTLYSSSNQLTNIDVSNNYKLERMSLDSNLLSKLDISLNTSLSHLYLGDMPTLFDVCVWTDPFPIDGIQVDTSGSPNVNFTTEGCLGITALNLPKHKEILIYPNPVYEILTIEVEQSEIYTVEVNSINGQLIFRTEMEASSRQLDISSFNKGVYFLTVRAKGFVKTEMIVKL